MLPISLQSVQHATPGSTRSDQPLVYISKLFAVQPKHNALVAVQVIMYDHRGVVKSGPARMEQQTSAMLAADAVQLLDGVWGRNTPVHVYG
jgi:pimeloyl-ACP methyl ester carboxylesterase